MSRHPRPGHDEGFVTRWSRRKSSARDARDPDAAPGEAASAHQGVDEPPVQHLDAQTLEHALDTQKPAEQAPLVNTSPGAGAPGSTDTDIEPASVEADPPDLPDIESLTEESDYSAFMAPNVSHEIRNLALRKLFRSGVFNIRDGLDDYDEDFTTFEKLGDIVTADMRHHAERKRALAEQEQAAESTALAADESNGCDDTNEGSNLNNGNVADSETEAQDNLASNANTPDHVAEDNREIAGYNTVQHATQGGEQDAGQPVLKGKLRRLNSPRDGNA